MTGRVPAEATFTDCPCRNGESLGLVRSDNPKVCALCNGTGKRARITLDAVMLKSIDLALDDDAPLDFYAAAITLGASKAEADQLDTRATDRFMRARGAI